MAFSVNSPADFNITGPDGARFTGADVTITDLNGARFTGVDGFRFTGADDGFEEGQSGLQSVDPELAFQINQTIDDSSLNAVIVFHQYPTESDLNDLRNIGIIGGTQFRALPMISVTTTRDKLIAVSHLSRVRSIYGNWTLNLNSDPYFKTTQIQRVPTDKDLQQQNAGMPVSGRNVTVAALDTGVNSTHNDPQSFSGVVETTRVEYGKLNDVDKLTAQNQAVVYESLSRFLMLPEGNKFRADSVVSRADLADALIRAGLVPQYVAANPLYSDVRDLTMRSVVESVQSNPNGKLILDAADGKFYPHSAASELVLALAFVKAANLESTAATSSLPLTVADAASIPTALRGYVAVALQKGWLSLENNKFNPNRAITRIKLAQVIVSLK